MAFVQVTDAVIERLIARWQRLQGEHLATLLRHDGDAVGDQRTQELFHRPGLAVIASQVAVLRITFEQALAFQVAADAQRLGLGQPGKLGAGRRLHPTEPQRAAGADLRAARPWGRYAVGQTTPRASGIEMKCSARRSGAEAWRPQIRPMSYL